MVSRNRSAQDMEPIQTSQDGVSFTLSDLPADEDFPLADYWCEHIPSTDADMLPSFDVRRCCIQGVLYQVFDMDLSLLPSSHIRP